jgi:hypothetical protein
MGDMKMLKQVIEVYELLDSAFVDGFKVAEIFKSRGLKNIDVKTVKGETGATDFIKVIINGSTGKSENGDAPTIGIIGRLGGIGARPIQIGMVSDAEGAITASACALKLADMRNNGDVLKGDVIITTHICPSAAPVPHEPVPFMGSPVDMAEMNTYEVDPAMDAILSVDTTRGNRIINFKGFAITPTVKEGYILKVSDDLLDLMEWTTGRPPRVCPITMQDITPYGNGLFHLNSIMQPSTATNSPVVGIAITAETIVPGCATGANHEIDVENAARFCIEVAKAFTEGKCKFYDEKEFNRIIKLYGNMNKLQSL